MKIKNIFKFGINSNMLKTIALVAMVIDHIGFYFYPFIPNALYVVFRTIGRIAMPIFVYSLVQGFFHTKNFNKYITRMGIFAVITQILITIAMVVNIKFVPDYITASQVYKNGNILFAFVVSLGLLKLIHEDILVKKWSYNKNLSLKILVVACALIALVFIPIDYGIEVTMLSIFVYFIEKFKIQIFMQKTKEINVKNILLKTVSDEKINMIYLLLIFTSLFLIVMYFDMHIATLFAIIPIALYNGEKGKINMKYLYYVIFPVHHILLYSLAMWLTLT